MPNIHYEGRVRTPVRTSRAVPILPEDPPRIRREFGEIEIDNGDGELDAVVQSYAVDGRNIRVLFGPYMGDYREFSQIAGLLGRGWETDRDNVRIPVRDWTFVLDQPLQTNLYAGSGGAEGGDDLEGKPKPLCFGRVRNMTPPLIDSTNVIYQVHDGTVYAIDGVFESGASITLDTGVGTGGDVADYTALVAASVTAGQYATCKAEGLFKLGSSPTGLITADVRGDVLDGAYANGVDTIAQRIITNRAGISLARVDTVSFATLATTASGEVGWFVGHQSRPTTAEVIDSIVRGVAGFWGAGRDGRIAAGRLVAPEATLPIYTLDDVSILDLRVERQIVPRFRQRVTYKPNWTPGQLDLAASVTASRRQFLTEAERSVAAADTSVQVRHIEALDPAPLISPFESSTDAQTLADSLLGLHKPDRAVYRASVMRLSYLFRLGVPLSVRWGRYGLDGGKTLILVGIDEDARTGRADMLLWG
ncbi:hypothetical protein [Pyruvatibacter mobilis]|uniref:hypothetical protein n=1 Tax=Pyruvatibacter mobilis TaxID=1712261 RepID=UPI003BB18187